MWVLGSTGRIYTEQCPWANGWQVWHLDNPFLLVISVVGIAIGITMIMNKLSFFLFKRRNKVIEHSQTGWTGVSTHRLALASPPPLLPPTLSLLEADEKEERQDMYLFLGIDDFV